MTLEAPQRPKTRAELEQQIIDAIATTQRDPLRFVLLCFPWGEVGELKDCAGPRAWQAEILNGIRDRLKDPAASPGAAVEAVIQQATASGHGIGKAQPKSLTIDTPAGQRLWGDIRPGDWLWGRDGKPTQVIARHEQGVKPIYRVAFDDRSSTLVCGEHVWTVKGRAERRNSRGWLNVTTEQIAARGVKRPNGKAQARQWEIPRHGAVDYPPQAVPLHAYALGVWLGDGGRRTARITTGDQPVIDRLAALGFDLRFGSKRGTTAQSVHLCGIQPALRSLGIFDRYSFEKSVPAIYKHNTAEVRAETLRGLLDTDGECGKGGAIIFSSTSLALADDVVWLARSLGGKARISPTVKMPTFNGPNGEKKAGRPCYSATLQMPHGFRSFYIDRKQVRVNCVEDRYLSRWIESVEPAGEADCMCVTVAAEDGLYLANDFIVTHNSALVAWLILWAVSTMVDARVVVTANTESQLRTKTWPELAKWHRLAINRHWWTCTATSLYSIDAAHEKTWRADAIPWSENNTEAFAGLHNQGRRLVLIFDEASAISDKVWEVAEGALTDSGTEILWLVFGNPTRNTGRFRECFGRNKHRWVTRQIDSRTVEGVNREQLDKLVADNGEDSDTVKVRIRGEFPVAGFNQLIPSDVIERAQTAEATALLSDPLLVGVDVARFGDDQTVIRFRRGRDAQTIPPVKMRGADTMQVAGKVAEIIARWNPDGVFIDVGMGAGVIDRLRQLGHRVIEVNFGEAASGEVDEMHCANKGTEMWAKMRRWFMDGAAIDNDRDLRDGLIGREYTFDARNHVILEKKSEMKKRGLASPDDADALALTFAHPVLPKTLAVGIARQSNRQVEIDFDPFA